MESQTSKGEVTTTENRLCCDLGEAITFLGPFSILIAHSTPDTH